MAASDPLLRIREPHVVRPRGRPHNRAVTLPEAIRIEGYETHRRRVMAPDLHRNPSQWETVIVRTTPTNSQRGSSQGRARGSRGRGASRGNIGRGVQHQGAAAGSTMDAVTALLRQQQ